MSTASAPQSRDDQYQESSSEQSNKHNLTDCEDEEDMDQLPSHVIVETVQYEDYIKEQKNNGEMIEIEDKEDESVEKAPTQARPIADFVLFKPKFNCTQPGCQYRTCNGSDLKRHQRIHTGLKPYKCKWPQCQFAGTDRSNALAHIRRHLKQHKETKLADPKDFLEVVL